MCHAQVKAQLGKSTKWTASSKGRKDCHAIDQARQGKAAVRIAAGGVRRPVLQMVNGQARL